jgi:hypothetical protein
VEIGFDGERLSLIGELQGMAVYSRPAFQPSFWYRSGNPNSDLTAASMVKSFFSTSRECALPTSFASAAR